MEYLDITYQYGSMVRKERFLSSGPSVLMFDATNDGSIKACYNFWLKAKANNALEQISDRYRRKVLKLISIDIEDDNHMRHHLSNAMTLVNLKTNLQSYHTSYKELILKQLVVSCYNYYKEDLDKDTYIE